MFNLFSSRPHKQQDRVIPVSVLTQNTVAISDIIASNLKDSKNQSIVTYDKKVKYVAEKLESAQKNLDKEDFKQTKKDLKQAKYMTNTNVNSTQEKQIKKLGEKLHATEISKGRHVNRFHKQRTYETWLERLTESQNTTALHR